MQKSQCISILICIKQETASRRMQLTCVTTVRHHAVISFSLNIPKLYNYDDIVRSKQRFWYILPQNISNFSYPLASWTIIRIGFRVNAYNDSCWTGAKSVTTNINDLFRFKEQTVFPSTNIAPLLCRTNK